MRAQRTIQCFTIHFLSPVHIGAQEQLTEHDVLSDDDKLIRFRTDRILEAISKSDELIEKYIREGLKGIVDWLRDTAHWRDARLYEVSMHREPRWGSELIRPFIADYMLRPYIPGSSIKGAIRTALAWALIRHRGASQLRQYVGKRTSDTRLERESDRRRAGQLLLQILLGKDPTHDILRCLHVSDSTPAPTAHLKILPTLIAMCTDAGLKWIQRPRKRRHSTYYTDDYNRAVASFCECLDDSANGLMNFTVTLDEFLQNGEIGKGRHDISVPQELNWDETMRRVVANWGHHCNEFSKQVAQWECRWWQQVEAQSRASNSKLIASALVRFYQALGQHARDVADENAVILNLGWGGGWLSKTVTYEFGDKIVNEMVRQYNLDRGAKSRPFPKTRKVVWRVANEVANEWLPMGWIMLKPISTPQDA